jgi:hypothetical protein
MAVAWSSPASGDGFWEPRQPHGGQVALGAGLIGAGVSGGGRAFDGASGAGLQLVMDYRLTEALAWDLRLGGFWTHFNAPAEINYPADDGDWSIAETGLHYDLYRGDGYALWAGAAVSLHYGRMSTWAYSAAGFGWGPSFGIDLRPAGPLLVRLGARLAWAGMQSSAGDDLGTAFVVAGGLDLLFVFR